MIILPKNKDVKELFEKEGIIYPFKKSNGKYGVKGSSICDNKLLKESLLILIRYLEDNNIVRFE